MTSLYTLACFQKCFYGKENIYRSEKNTVFGELDQLFVLSELVILMQQVVQLIWFLLHLV